MGWEQNRVPHQMESGKFHIEAKLNCEELEALDRYLELQGVSGV